MQKKGVWITIFLLPVSLIFLLIYAIPLITVFFTSLFDYKIYPQKFNFVGLSNYINMFTQDADFAIAFRNTLIWLLLHCTVHITLGVVIALMLAKKPFGWKFIRTAYMIPNIISSAALGIIFLNLYNPQFGAVNSIIRLLGFKDFGQNWLFDSNTAFGSVTMTWIIFASYTTILILSEVLAIPESIFEAAKVDGATGFETDLYIALPMIRNAIGTTIIMAATYMLQMFDLIYMTTRGGPGTATTNLPLYLYKTALVDNNYGYANTIGVFIIVIGVMSMILITRIFKVGDADA